MKRKQIVGRIAVETCGLYPYNWEWEIHTTSPSRYIVEGTKQYKSKSSAKRAAKRAAELLGIKIEEEGK